MFATAVPASTRCRPSSPKACATASATARGREAPPAARLVDEVAEHRRLDRRRGRCPSARACRRARRRRRSRTGPAPSVIQARTPSTRVPALRIVGVELPRLELRPVAQPKRSQLLGIVRCERPDDHRRQRSWSPFATVKRSRREARRRRAPGPRGRGGAWNGSAIVRSLQSSLTGSIPSEKPYSSRMYDCR